MTIRELLETAAARAAAAGSDASLWDARLLLAHALGGLSPLALDLRRVPTRVSRARFLSCGRSG